MKNKKDSKKILALIPTRQNSTRLPPKALLPINNLPLIMHVYKRTLLAKKVDEAIICCDDPKISNVVKKFGAKVKAYAKIQDLNLTEDLKTVTMKDGSVYSAPVLILATGGIP